MLNWLNVAGDWQKNTATDKSRWRSPLNGRSLEYIQNRIHHSKAASCTHLTKIVSCPRIKVPDQQSFISFLKRGMSLDNLLTCPGNKLNHALTLQIALKKVPAKPENGIKCPVNQSPLHGAACVCSAIYRPAQRPQWAIFIFRGIL